MREHWIETSRCRMSRRPHGDTLSGPATCPECRQSVDVEGPLVPQHRAPRKGWVHRLRWFNPELGVHTISDLVKMSKGNKKKFGKSNF